MNATRDHAPSESRSGSKRPRRLLIWGSVLAILAICAWIGFKRMMDAPLYRPGMVRAAEKVGSTSFEPGLLAFATGPCLGWASGKKLRP